MIETSVRRPVTVVMASIAVALFGFISLDRLGINLLPDIAYPTLTVRTEHDGAAPAEIEELITRRIEERLGVVGGVQRMHSVSAAGQSDVVLEFAWGVDMDLAAIEVREKLDLVRLPLDVERPMILRLNPNFDPVLRLALSRSDTAAAATGAAGIGAEAAAADARAGLQELRRFAEDYVKRRLDPVSGVAAVRVVGGFEDEIEVLVDQERLAQLGVTVQALGQRLAAVNVNVSGGRLEDGEQEFLIRTMSEFRTVDDVAATIVFERDGRQVRVRDVAEVRQSFRERDAITRIDGREAIEIALYKEGDANTVAMAADVRATLDALRQEMPGHFHLDVIYDQSRFIVEAIDGVRASALEGAAIAVFVLFLFLREVRATLILSLSIPLSVLATFGVMHWLDLTLNVMSLGGIALAVGMLVDNGIVVLENVARHRGMGRPRLVAALDGTREVAGAVVASTLTTVAVFLPLVFVEGIAGQLFRDQALTVTGALVASLVVAFTVVPMLAASGGGAESGGGADTRGGAASGGDGAGHAGSTAAATVSTAPHADRPSRGPALLASAPLLLLLRGVFGAGRAAAAVLRLAVRPLLDGFDAGYRALERTYVATLRGALRARAATLLVAASLLALSAWALTRMPADLIPPLAQGEYRADLVFSPGTRVEQTDATLAGVAAVALRDPDVVRTYAVAGTGGRLDASSAVGGENIGEINVVVDRGPAAEQRSMAAMRAVLEDLPDLAYTVDRPKLFTFATPLEVVVSGPELADITAVAAPLAEAMERDPRFADVASTLRPGYPEVQVFFDQERAAALGLSVPDIARQVVAQVRGDVPTEFSWRDRKIDIRIWASEEARDSVADIAALIVNPQSPRPVRLDAVAELRLGVGPAEIQRIQQQRSATVSASVTDGDLAGGAARVRELLAELPHPTGVTSRVGGQNEEMERSFASLRFALLLAVAMVYLVMASLFESLLQPLVILLTIPLALVGAVAALAATQTPLSVVVFIGGILLAGIVVNNAIVLVDRVNQLRAEGASRADALLTAGRQRLRPILMTTLTTVLGLVPMALGLGEGVELRTPMAITVIGGLSASTLLTLLVIPVVYDLVDRRRDAAAVDAGIRAGASAGG
jgi:HAE1 family hydrophobic/amphiphilic exporter-1